MIDDLLTVADVAGILGKPKRTVQAMAKDGRLPGMIVGVGYLFNRSDIEALAARDAA